MSSFLVVGRGECSTKKVHKILRFSTSFHLLREKWSDVARDLDISKVDIDAIRDALRLDKMGLSDALEHILELWVGGEGDKALLGKLIQSLEENGLADCAQRLRKEFQFYTDAIKKYVRLPKALRNALDSNDFSSGLLILATPDIAITMQKIRENLENSEIFSNYEALLNFLSAGNEWSILVVTDKDPNTLANLLENLSGSKMFDLNGKIVLVTEEEEKKMQDVLMKYSSQSNYIKIISDEMEWNDLNHSSKHVARKRAELHIGFRLQSELLESALCGKVLADIIHNRDDLQLIKSTLPDACSYYVKRNLLTRNIISEDVFKSKGQDVFVCQGISRSQLSAMIKDKLTACSLEQLEEVTSKFIILDQPSHFYNICHISKDPVHFLRKRTDGKWKWIKSKGKISNIQQHISKREAQKDLNEDAFFTKIIKKPFEESISVCISDSPGMGKSFLLAQIGRKLHKQFPGRIIAFVVLPELIKEVHKRDINDLKAAIKLSLAKLIGESFLGELFLESKLDADDGKLWIELLLDGFDEIDYSSRSLSYEMLKTLKSFKSVRIWVTSRPHLLENLESTLSVLGYNMQPFCEDNQIHFLTHFWEERLAMPEDKFAHFASASLQFLKACVDSSEEDIAGIPLQCLMIAEIFQDEAKTNAGLSITTISTKSFTFIQLYDHFIHKKIELYFKKYSCSNQLTNDAILDIHKWLSLQLLFPDYAEKVQPMLGQTGDYSEEILKIGLLEASSKLTTPRFIHRTFAEYLTALFAVEALGEQSSYKNDIVNFLYDQVLANELTNDSESKETILIIIWKIFCILMFIPRIPKLQNEDRTRRFQYPVICYFLNFLISQGDNVGLPELEHLHLSKFSTIQKIIFASVTHSFINILKLLRDDQVVKNFGRMIFNKNLLLAAVRFGNLDLIRFVFTRFEEYYQLTQKIKEDVHSVASERKEFSVLEFVLKEKKCEARKIYQESDLELLLDLMINDPRNFSD